ncbi:MAG: hypothetical protein VCC00_12220 [Deltaproteobacteria bacterium]
MLRIGYGFLRSLVFVCLAAVLVLSISACESRDPAQAAASRFVDSYYVEIDLKAAMPYATGLAFNKLVTEQELLEGIGVPLAAGKPTVHYRFVEEGASRHAERRSFLYELTITFSDAQVVRQALVTVQQQPDRSWRVANFQELS